MGFNSNAARRVAVEYSPAKRLNERFKSEKIGVINKDIKNVWPGAVNIICKTPKSKINGYFLNREIITSV